MQNHNAGSVEARLGMLFTYPIEPDSETTFPGLPNTTAMAGTSKFT